MSSPNEAPLAVMLMGPTCSGKTDLAVKLVQAFPFEIVSVDSAMVYRGMDIGTAKPDAATLARAPHRLIDICDPADTYSAARFRLDALREMQSIQAAGRIPLLVGGTGLYFRALERGLAELPAADPAVRARLNAEADRLGWPAMHRRLAAIDPESAARLHPNDSQRLQRALEVFELSNVSLSDWLARKTELALPYRVIKTILAPRDRELLYVRVEQRFLQMLTAGLVEEARALFKRPELSPDLASVRMVGYCEVWRFLKGQIDHAEMVRQAVQSTRRLAKRQLTWFRAEQQARYFDAAHPELFTQVVEHLKTSGL
jgi:tRNA dimethylallyltransferase